MPFPNPTLNTAIEAVISRVMDAYWRGKDVSLVARPPIALNNEPVTVMNAAGTGEVEVFRVNASNQIVMQKGVFAPVALTTNGAIPPHTASTYIITKAGVLADTLAAPTAGTDDGLVIEVTSSTAFAHTITATGLFQTGTASVNLATFAANAGAGLRLMAYNAKWVVMASVGITFS